MREGKTSFLGLFFFHLLLGDKVDDVCGDIAVMDNLPDFTLSESAENPPWAFRRFFFDGWLLVSL